MLQNMNHGSCIQDLVVWADLNFNAFFKTKVKISSELLNRASCHLLQRKQRKFIHRCTCTRSKSWFQIKIPLGPIQINYLALIDLIHFDMINRVFLSNLRYQSWWELLIDINHQPFHQGLINILCIYYHA